MTKWYLSQECKGGSTFKKTINITHINGQKHGHRNRVARTFKQNPTLLHDENAKKHNTIETEGNVCSLVNSI